MANTIQFGSLYLGKGKSPCHFSSLKKTRPLGKRPSCPFAENDILPIRIG